jgi:hypothetical protein
VWRGDSRAEYRPDPHDDPLANAYGCVPHVEGKKITTAERASAALS